MCSSCCLTQINQASIPLEAGSRSGQKWLKSLVKKRENGLFGHMHRFKRTEIVASNSRNKKTTKTKNLMLSYWGAMNTIKVLHWYLSIFTSMTILLIKISSYFHKALCNTMPTLDDFTKQKLSAAFILSVCTSSLHCHGRHLYFVYTALGHSCTFFEFRGNKDCGAKHNNTSIFCCFLGKNRDKVFIVANPTT